MSRLRVLALNCGGATFKYKVLDMPEEEVRCAGLVDRLRTEQAALTHVDAGGERATYPCPNADYEQAISLAFDKAAGGCCDHWPPDAVAHKLAHGGVEYRAPCLITDAVKRAMRSVTELVPLHNPPSLRAVEICEGLLPGVPQVGVFETGFHVTAPPEAYLYGIPFEWCERHGARKFGFHSCSHRYVTERMASLLRKPVEDVSLISCHLGSGTSVCAVRNGESVDISSGLTPQSGTIMSTRPGDFDPAVVPYVMEQEGLSYQQVMGALVLRGGLLGISGVSGDVRDLERAAAEGNGRAELALKVFVYHVRKYIGQFLILVPALDALVFTGGIGEKSYALRRQVCDGLERFGILLDAGRNQAVEGEGCVSRAGSPVAIWVVPTDEEVVVSREAYRLLRKEAVAACH